MFKSFILYGIYFSALLIAALVPSLAWLAPVAMLVLLAGTLWLWRNARHPMGTLGFGRDVSWLRFLVYGLLLGLAFPLAAIAVQAMADWLALEPATLSTAELIRSLLLSVVRNLFVVAFEEVVFRGYYLQRLRARLSMWPAVLMSALLWALSHLPNMLASGLSAPQLVLGTLTFILWGSVLGIGFLYTGKTLWFPFGLHYGNNLGFSLLGTLLTKTYLAPAWLVGHPAWAPESGLVGAAFWAVSFLAAWQIARRRLEPDRLGVGTASSE
jgi:membrane protease YdiL (CAAX protease family)